LVTNQTLRPIAFSCKSAPYLHGVLVLFIAIFALVLGWVPVASAQITLDDMP